MAFAKDDDRVRVNDPFLEQKLFKYASASVLESTRHSTFSISVDKAPIPGLALCNGVLAWPSNVAVILPPQAVLIHLEL